jgi:hypothetical protein
MNLNQIIMKKARFLLALIMLLGLTIHCTEDDDMEAHVAKANQPQYLSGEEGDQEPDTDRE